MEKLDINKIVQVPLLESQYYKEEFIKKQIVLHHTAGGSNAKNVVASWKSNTERVATAFIIDGEGVIHQCFSSRYWAHHLGTKSSNNIMLNKQSIAIEICNWGILTRKGDKYYTYTNKEIPASEVLTLDTPFRGSKYYHKYNAKQIESVRQLIVYLSEVYNIPINYKPTIWDVNVDALKGEQGLFTHVSYRRDKSDCAPDPSLIQMLKQNKL